MQDFQLDSNNQLLIIINSGRIDVDIKQLKNLKFRCSDKDKNYLR
jgi:hypothetical protein